MSFRTRVSHIMVALDVFLFACACLGNVKRGETASAAAYSCLIDGKWQGKLFVPIIDAIFWVLVREKNHCKSSFYTFITGMSK